MVYIYIYIKYIFSLIGLTHPTLFTVKGNVKNIANVKFILGRMDIYSLSRSCEDEKQKHVILKGI